MLRPHRPIRWRPWWCPRPWWAKQMLKLGSALRGHRAKGGGGHSAAYVGANEAAARICGAVRGGCGTASGGPSIASGGGRDPDKLGIARRSRGGV